MIDTHLAIITLHPEVAVVRGNIAYDDNGNKIEYDMQAVEAKAIKLEAQAKADTKAAADAKQSALNKLMALGLTEEEALALGVK
jgi:hypothetical protein